VSGRHIVHRRLFRFHALLRVSYRFDSPRRMGLPPIRVVFFDDLRPERSGEVPAGAHPRLHLFLWRHAPRHRGSITGRLHCPSVLGRHSGSFRPRPIGCVRHHAKSTTGRFMERSGINHVRGLIGLVPGENAVETLQRLYGMTPTRAIPTSTNVCRPFPRNRDRCRPSSGRTNRR